MIRVGSLYNYIDYGRERIDYSGLRELPFRKKLLTECQNFVKAQNKLFEEELEPIFEENNFKIAELSDLTAGELKKANSFFDKIIFPMLTPMVYDNYHTFPILMNKLLIFSVVTRSFGEIIRSFHLYRSHKISSVFMKLSEMIRFSLYQ